MKRRGSAEKLADWPALELLGGQLELVEGKLELLDGALDLGPAPELPPINNVPEVSLFDTTPPGTKGEP